MYVLCLAVITADFGNETTSSLIALTGTRVSRPNQHKIYLYLYGVYRDLVYKIQGKAASNRCNKCSTLGMCTELEVVLRHNQP